MLEYIPSVPERPVHFRKPDIAQDMAKKAPGVSSIAGQPLGIVAKLAAQLASFVELDNPNRKNWKFQAGKSFMAYF